MDSTEFDQALALLVIISITLLTACSLVCLVKFHAAEEERLGLYDRRRGYRTHHVQYEPVVI